MCFLVIVFCLLLPPLPPLFRLLLSFFLSHAVDAGHGRVG